MFSNIIASTAMTTQAANAYFADRITGDAYSGDCSFLSTLRALLDKRIGDDNLYFTVVSFSAPESAIEMQNDFCNYVHRRYDCPNWMTVVNLCGAASDKAFDAIKDGFAQKEGWVRLVPITDFFSRSFDVICFVHAASKQAIFFVKNLNMRKYHQLQVGALTALPWYFNPKTDGRPSEIEMELFASLQEKTGDHYCDVLQRIAEAANYEETYTRRMLCKIESAYTQRRLDNLNAELANLHRTIAECQDRINSCCISINDRSEELYGLETKLAKGEGDSMLCDYFISNRSLKLEQISREVIVHFHVNTYMTYFDPNAAETYLSNEHSDFYRYRGDWTIPEVKKLFNDIFIDQTIRIRMVAGYKLDLRGGFWPVEKMEYGGDEYDRIPNPHVAHWGCLGDYNKRITERQSKSDYIGVLENAIASAMSVNVTDSPVVKSFMSDIFAGVGGSCFELDDGRKMNINEVREYVKKEMEAENE